MACHEAVLLWLEEYGRNLDAKNQHLDHKKMASILDKSLKSHEISSAKYVFPPPQFDDLHYDYRKPTPPFKGAEPWQCSLYYFWFEYLKRHEGYRQTCLSGGKGKYAKLFEDFGDVHQLDFINWWRNTFHLFEEPRAIRRVDRERILNSTDRSPNSSKLYFEVDLQHYHPRLVREFQEVAWIYISEMKFQAKLKLQNAEENKASQNSSQGEILRSRISKALYPIYANPTLSSLCEHLKMWDIYVAHPDATAIKIAEIAGIRVNQVVNGETISRLKKLNLPYADLQRTIDRRKQLAVQRHLRIGEQYIENAALGIFPKRLGR